MGLFDGIKRAGGVFGDIITGPTAPGLTPEQHEALKKKAFMQAGLQAMMASGPNAAAPGIAQIFAQSAMQGQNAYQGGAQQINAQNARQAMMQPFQGQAPTRENLHKLLQTLIGSGQLEEAKLISEQIKALPGPQALSAGAKLVGPDGQMIADNPVAVDPLQGLPPELIGIAQLLGVNPAQIMALPEAQRTKLLEEWRKNKESGATRISQTAQLQERTANGVVDIAIDDYKGVQASARTARSRLNALTQMGALLSSGMRTGGMQALTEPLRKVAASFGYDVGNMSQQALFQALSARMALDSKEGMTGPMSDRDIKFLQQMVPSLSNTIEGNRLLIGVMQRLAQRDIALAAEANRWVAEHGVLDHRWLQHQQEWAQGQNLFGDLLNPAERARMGY